MIVLPFTDEFDGKPGRELGDGYVRTNSATRIELVGTWTVAGSVSIMTNEVVPAPAVAVPR